jgi:hypothetical protein
MADIHIKFRIRRLGIIRQSELVTDRRSDTGCADGPFLKQPQGFIVINRSRAAADAYITGSQTSAAVILIRIKPADNVFYLYCGVCFWVLFLQNEQVKGFRNTGRAAMAYSGQNCFQPVSDIALSDIVRGNTDRS